MVSEINSTEQSDLTRYFFMGKRHVTKKKRKKKGQAQIDNPDTLATPATKDT
jgi:hypothetical protein